MKGMPEKNLLRFDPRQIVKCFFVFVQFYLGIKPENHWVRDQRGTLQALSSAFNMLRFSQFLKEFVWGAFLLLIMVTNYIYHRRRIQQS
jgi:hypothetical protein